MGRNPEKKPILNIKAWRYCRQCIIYLLSDDSSINYKLRDSQSTSHRTAQVVKALRIGGLCYLYLLLQLTWRNPKNWRRLGYSPNQYNTDFTFLSAVGFILGVGGTEQRWGDSPQVFKMLPLRRPTLPVLPAGRETDTNSILLSASAASHIMEIHMNFETELFFLFSFDHQRPADWTS